jgi:phenylpyruvate tautomerase PptA (4-oxalocrotonate tautomerase family)
MPLMRVALTAGAFDDVQKARLATALTESGCRAESVPDHPSSRMRALVVFDEIAPGFFYSAGQQADAAIAGVFVDWYVSAGVLDAARKERFAREVQEVAAAARNGDVGPKDDGRMVVTSCVIHEVPEGQWAQNGSIRRLPEMVSLARFEHLTSIG